MVPTFDLYIQPFLDCLKGGEEKNLKTLSGELASYFKLTEEDLADTVAKGTQSRHYNRVNWAGTYTLKVYAVEIRDDLLIGEWKVVVSE